MQNNLNNFPQHGASATPTQIALYAGHYGAGILDTWMRSSTIRAGMRGTLTLTIDDTAQWLPYAAPNIQLRRRAEGNVVAANAPVSWEPNAISNGRFGFAVNVSASARSASP